jgi:hypothetical protein
MRLLTRLQQYALRMRLLTRLLLQKKEEEESLLLLRARVAQLCPWPVGVHHLPRVLVIQNAYLYVHAASCSPLPSL